MVKMHKNVYLNLGKTEKRNIGIYMVYQKCYYISINGIPNKNQKEGKS